MRMLPFFKPKRGFVVAGGGLDTGGGGGGTSGSHTYSTTPKKVGTWIDGRDVMEFSFMVDFPSGASGRDTSLFTFASVGANNLETIISADIILRKTQSSLAQISFNYYASTSDVMRWYTNDTNTEFMVFCNGGYLNNSKIYGTIRYVETIS